MKRKFACVLWCTLCLCLALAGCGGEDTAALNERTEGTGRDEFVLGEYTISLQIPEDWEDHYLVKPNVEDDTLVFYCDALTDYGGWLFSISIAVEEQLQYLSSYDILAQTDRGMIVATYPNDIQFEGAPEDLVQQYQRMEQEIEGIIDTFELVE